MSEPLEPTHRTERIGLLDAMRGIAVLGILLMNIVDFGLPNAYEDPSNWGGATGADLFVWRVNALLFEGAMRGLFTLLFGAGVLLFLERHAARGAGRDGVRLYFRRTLWLIMFGLVNGYLLLWSGDILFYYGVAGLLLFMFRKLSARTLFLCAGAALLLQWSITAYEWSDYYDVWTQAHSGNADALIELSRIEQDFKPGAGEQQALIAAVRDSYARAFEVLSERTRWAQTSWLLRHGLLDVLAVMLLGMALFRSRVLTGEASSRTYVALMVAGYAIGLGVNLYEIALLERTSFSVYAFHLSWLTYDAGRIPTTLGHVGAIVLLHRAFAASWPMRALASVGQMALTHYLSHSLMWLFVFTGAGLALFGQLRRHELYYIVFAVWIAQIAFSRWWLARYRFGPAEWVWRSLTYHRMQPLAHTREAVGG